MSSVAGALAEIIEHDFYFESNPVVSGTQSPGPRSIWNRDATAGITFGASGLTITGTLSFSGVMYLANGSAALPSLAFTNSTTTGLYRNASNVIGVAIGGVAALAIGASAPTITAATDTAGADVFVQTAAGGATPTAQRDGGDYNVIAGAGSASHS